MSYNGSGTFNINTTGQPVVAGTVISSSAFNALTTDLATGLTTAITKDGQTTTTARITFAQGVTSSLVTDSSSVSTGSIITAGGAGIAKNLYVGVNANVAGTLGVTGVATFSSAPIYSSLTASSAVATDASKGLVSVTNTGTGNNVLATSPTITTPTISSLSSAAATALTLQSAGTTAITVDTSQNVGIGTSSPSQILDIVGTTPIINIQGGATTNARGLQFKYGASITTGSLTNFGGTGETALSGGASGSSGYFLTFKTDGTERMRITSSGNVLIGKTTTGSDTAGFEYEGSGGALLLTRASNATCLFNRQGSSGSIISFRFQNGDCGTISVNTGSTAYNTSSDYRLKENIAPLTSGLDKVAQLKPVTYKWKSDGSYGEGFIAHELAEVCPLAVHGEKDAVDENGKIVPQGIDTSFLVATLTAAIQELKAINDQQAVTINALTARIVALESK